VQDPQSFHSMRVGVCTSELRNNATRNCSCAHTILTCGWQNVAQRWRTQSNPTLFAFYDTTPVVELQANKAVARRDGRPPSFLSTEVK
jgi:hypothetical protein